MRSRASIQNIHRVQYKTLISLRYCSVKVRRSYLHIIPNTWYISGLSIICLFLLFIKFFLTLFDLSMVRIHNLCEKYYINGVVALRNTPEVINFYLKGFSDLYLLAINVVFFITVFYDLLLWDM